MGDTEAESFVQSPRGIGFDDAERDRLAGSGRVVDQADDDFGADAASPEGCVDKDLLQIWSPDLYRALHPADIGIVTGDDLDFPCVPAFTQAPGLRGHVE